MTCRRAPPAAAAPLLALLLVAAVAAPAAARGAPEAALAHPRSLLQSTCCDGVTVSASAGAAATCVGSAITFSVPAAAGSAGGATLNIAPIGTGSVAVATAGLSTSTCNPAKSAAWGWAAANNQLSLSTPDTNVEPGCTNATCSADAAKEGTRDTTIAIAGAHSCTIRDNDGSVWCSGENEDGQLGNGATTDQKVPVQVTLSASVPLTGVKSIAAGSKDEDDGHTCACTAEGAAFCWGRRESGQVRARHSAAEHARRRSAKRARRGDRPSRAAGPEGLGSAGVGRGFARQALRCGNRRALRAATAGPTHAKTPAPPTPAAWRRRRERQYTLQPPHSRAGWQHQ
ncbi:MAG: hypothetical protein J3K34DRAFT_523171, partial [Monoraphidium minutum]